MFDRYSPPARRAIYYAREAALYSPSTEINSNHILSGLLVEQSSRANTVLQLNKIFVDEAARMCALQKFPQPRDIPLSRDSKRIVAGAAVEADRTNQYWIDTDHLAASILRDNRSEAAMMLAKAGLQLDQVRKAIRDGDISREEYGSPPHLWWLTRPITRKGRIAGFVYLMFVFILLKALMPLSCGIHR